ncbi:hypothetical protein JCM11641_000966 [Rhodosporidiobolus odoratus]
MTFTLDSVQLAYFPIAGRGEPLRLILEDAGQKYEETNDVAAFREKKWDLDEYRFNQLPRLTVNGTHLFQQDAILRFLAKALGYTGSGDIFQDALVDQLQDACEDLNLSYTSKVYSANALEQLTLFIKEYVPKVLKQLEHMFKENSSEAGYLVDDKPSFAEFHLLYLLRVLCVLNPSILSSYPTLQAWQQRMNGRPGIKAYLESGRVKEMLNGTDTAQKAIV